MTNVRIAFQNTAPNQGLFLTPFWFGAHDENFDLFDVTGEASPGLEQIAEDGAFNVIAGEFSSAQPNGEAGLVFSPVGPFAPGLIGGSRVLDLDAETTGQLSFAAMLLPSNDAFIGTDDAVALFDAHGNFLGEQNIAFTGGDVLDAGTEVNTEEDAAFLNQTAADAGVTENGTILRHPGFNGSTANPVGDGDQNILGGVNMFGQPIDETLADFTLPQTEIATLHINTVVSGDLSARNDYYGGTRSDDVINGGDGNDFLRGRQGWDELNGGEGHDTLAGNRGADVLIGGEGDDVLRGGTGRDYLDGGVGDDILNGGRDADVFIYRSGDGEDIVRRFDVDEDYFILQGSDFSSFQDVLDNAVETRRGVEIVFDDDNSIALRGVEKGELNEDNFAFFA